MPHKCTDAGPICNYLSVLNQNYHLTEQYDVNVKERKFGPILVSQGTLFLLFNATRKPKKTFYLQ